MRQLDDLAVILPAAKRRELAHVVEIIREGFTRAIRHRTQPRFRNGHILKIILFGSYARGDWVEDPVGRYFSDYDILVVVDHEDLTDIPEFWAKTEDRLLEELTEGKALRTQVSLVYHSLDDVNEKLRLGRYFFMDILKDGILLHEEPGCSFVEPKQLSSDEALRETRVYFEEWFESAEQFSVHADDATRRGWLSKAAFELHQATERLYHCIFLVRTLYSPKTHNLNRLRALTEQLEPQLRSVWPTDSKFEKRAYNLLREAYIKARYSREYVIGADELSWLAERVAMLQTLVQELCTTRIAELESSLSPSHRS
ncbi:HEPN domain-containing protein [Sphingobium limneticum]|jgi:predicted nucleotidyltransferase/HEPN domain-containing protein|uniref:HEPN domain-containing protein n=1 Tax=Sphingobium TaxID=165695 RepID=UPI003137F3A4